MAALTFGDAFASRSRPTHLHGGRARASVSMKRQCEGPARARAGVRTLFAVKRIASSVEKKRTDAAGGAKKELAVRTGVGNNTLAESTNIVGSRGLATDSQSVNGGATDEG